MGAPARTLRAARDWGYRAEIRAVRILSPIFPRLGRKGSIGYKKSHADLVQEGRDEGPVFHLVFTRDRRGLDLVTMPANEFVELVQHRHPNADAFVADPYADAYVAVKARSSTWLGTLMRELIRAHP